MALFAYKGAREDGSRATGRVEAAGQPEAIAQLQAAGITASKIVPVKEPIKIEDLLARKRKVPMDQLVLFTRQLATLVDSGVAILQGLNILDAQIENVRFKAIIREVVDAVESGQALADALRAHPDTFSRLYVAMIEAGESSGTLDESLRQLAKQLENENRMRKQVKAAMRYPTIVLGVAVMVLVLLLVFVVPRFRSLFSALGGDLPLPTKVVISLSEVFVPGDGKLFPLIPALGTLIFCASIGALLLSFRFLKVPPALAVLIAVATGAVLGGFLYLVQFEPAWLPGSVLVSIPGGIQMITFFYDFDLPTAFINAPQGIGILARLFFAYLVFRVLKMLWRRFVKSPEGRRAWDGFRLRAPLKIGPMVQKVSMARFTRTLATLTSSGVPILTAFDIVRETAGNVLIEEASAAARERVAVGSSIHGALEASPAFPPLVTQMVAVGEETGALDEMLMKSAEYYEEEVDIAMKNIASLIEPIMVIFIGLVVGSIVVALYLPIFSIFSLLQAS